MCNQGEIQSSRKQTVHKLRGKIALHMEQKIGVERKAN